jgi:succinate-acetate transporter protein
MTAVNAGAEGSAATQETAAPPAVTGLLAGDPMMLGLPTFVVGSYALGLTLVGQVPGGLLGAPLPIIMAATALGLFITTIWAVAVGQSAVASVFGIFTGFWGSFAALVLGLTHGWFGVTPAAVVGTEEMFATSWLIVIVLLTLATLRLPSAFTAIFVFIDLALLFVLLGVSSASTGDLKTAGVFAIIFATLGAYCYFGQAAAATGGKALPLGRPLIKS